MIHVTSVSLYIKLLTGYFWFEKQASKNNNKKKVSKQASWMVGLLGCTSSTGHDETKDQSPYPHEGDEEDTCPHPQNQSPAHNPPVHGKLNSKL